MVNIGKQVGREDHTGLANVKDKNVDLNFGGDDAVVDVKVDLTKPKVKTLVAYRQPSKKKGDSGVGNDGK